MCPSCDEPDLIILLDRLCYSLAKGWSQVIIFVIITVVITLIVIVDISLISSCRCCVRFPPAIVGASMCNGVLVIQASSPDAPLMATSVSTPSWEERPQPNRQARSPRHSLLILSHSRCHSQLQRMNQKQRWWKRHQSGCGDRWLHPLL